MWFLTVRSPTGAPREYALKTGRTTLGRKSDNDVVVVDESASRVHAEIVIGPDGSDVILRDLGSMNGTFINRERLTRAHKLQPTDQLRIGQHIASLAFRDSAASGRRGTDTLPGTAPLNRESLLEAVDQHAILLFEVAHRLNTVIDLDTALTEVSRLTQTAMGADKCEIILAEKFDHLAELGFPTSIARQAIDQRSTVVVSDLENLPDGTVGQSTLLLKVRSAMCVPVMSGDDIIGLIYVYKTNPEARAFDPRDLQLAMGISNQAAMTIQRTRLLKKVRQGDRIRNLFQRFLSQPEADFVLAEYLRTNELPGLTEQILTVVFVDMRESVALAERLGARRFGDILTLYYHEMAKAIFDNNGLLNKFIGDGLMAVFGALGKPEPERHALVAALSMLDRLDNINRAEGENIEVGIGINTGVVVAGYIGSDERVEYTVLGDPVNVAQRLQGFARNQVFVSSETLAAVPKLFRTRPVGPVEIRGRLQPVEAVEILRATAPLPRHAVR